LGCGGKRQNEKILWRETLFWADIRDGRNEERKQTKGKDLKMGVGEQGQWRGTQFWADIGNGRQL
jgi:hypothetical protein